MTGKHKPGREVSLPSFDQMPPIDPDEFIVTYRFAINAATGGAIIDDPSTRALRSVEEDGTVSGIRFVDNPLTRALLALTREIRRPGGGGERGRARARAAASTSPCALPRASTKRRMIHSCHRCGARRSEISAGPAYSEILWRG